MRYIYISDLYRYRYRYRYQYLSRYVKRVRYHIYDAKGKRKPGSCSWLWHRHCVDVIAHGQVVEQECENCDHETWEVHGRCRSVNLCCVQFEKGKAVIFHRTAIGG